MIPTLHPDADREFDEAIAYYNAQRSGLGWELFDELHELIAAIGRNPRRCGWLDDSHRRCTSRRFRYSIVYDPDVQPVHIVAIHHPSRQPDYWRYRT